MLSLLLHPTSVVLSPGSITTLPPLPSSSGLIPGSSSSPSCPSCHLTCLTSGHSAMISLFSPSLVALLLPSLPLSSLSPVLLLPLPLFPSLSIFCRMNRDKIPRKHSTVSFLRYRQNFSGRLRNEILDMLQDVVLHRHCKWMWHWFPLSLQYNLPEITGSAQLTSNEGVSQPQVEASVGMVLFDWKIFVF